VKTRTITVSRMAELPVGLRHKMRQLSLGPYVPWGAWSWTFHDGSCWAALCFSGGETTEDALIGWAALTQEQDVLPVIGVYVDNPHRGYGHATALVVTLLQALLASGELYPGAEVANSAWRFPKYDEIIRGCGLKPVVWK
jgi:hypothetical protein